MLFGFLRWVDQPKEYLLAKPWAQLFSLVLIFYGFIASLLLMRLEFSFKMFAMVLFLDGIISTILSFSCHLRFWQLRAIITFAFAIIGLIGLAGSNDWHSFFLPIFIIAAILKLIFGNFLF